MSQETIDKELVKAIEDFVDAKLSEDWATRQKPFNHGLVEAANKLVVERKDLMHKQILQLTWAASAK
jgi:phage-related tail fiber protein